MSRFIAYKITCSVNGKMYIGITSRSLSRRWACHWYDSKSKETALARAMRKHGKDNFSIEELTEAASSTELLVLERGLIAQYGTLAPSGYNSTVGGERMDGWTRSTESRKQHSVRMTDIWKQPGRKEWWASHLRDRLADPAYREKISRSLKLRTRSDEFLQASKEKMRAMRNDPAIEAKRRAGAAAYWANPENKKRHLEALQRGRYGRKE